MDVSLAFDELDDILWIYDLDRNTIQYVNVSIQLLGDVTKQSVQDDSSQLTEIIHPSDIPACLKSFDLCKKKGFAAVECRLNDPAEERWMLVKGRVRNIEGTNVIVGSATDITLQKRAEKSFARFSERYDKILQSTLTGYILVNLEGYVVNCNSAFASMLDYQVNDVASTNLSDLYDPSLPNQTIIQEVRKQGHARGETTLWSRDQRRVPIEFSASLIELHDRDLIVFFIEDNSQKEKIREQLTRVMKHSEEVSRMKTSIMANVTHEIKSPIHRIKGLVEIMGQEFDSASLAKYLDRIQENSDRVIQSLTALVEFSKLDSQVAQNHFKPTNLWSTVEELRAELTEQAHKQGLAINFPKEDPNVMVMGDHFLLQESWRIIIGNSIKFTEKGTITIGFAIGADQVDIQVEDTGIGIGSSFISKAFVPFTQESDGFSRSHEGLGLGLSIARRYIQSHDGEINLRQNEHKGTTVIVTLPVIS